MKIAVDKNAPIPAYKQVVDGIATAIDRGDVRSGSRLPSVRNLALELGLNVNTVARAYRDLERAGVIDTMPGMGTFVAEPGPARDSAPAGAWPRPAVVQPSGDWRRFLAAALELARSEG
ncbi:MAG: GntR family transcriptional regulator, partial [Acidobacteriota bacterium]